MTSLSSTISASPGDATPAGIQKVAELQRRRRLVLAFNAATSLVLLWGAWTIASAGGGWSVIDILMFLCFCVAAPWSMLGFWNAALGLWLLHGKSNGLDEVMGFAAKAGNGPLKTRTAIFMTIRNEDPQRAMHRFSVIKKSVDATGHGASFDYFVLSDTSDAMVGEKEEKAFARWQAQETGSASKLTYRRRDNNKGYKAGNVTDFCERWGADYEFMLPLDADSLMDGKTILKLARIGEAWPKLGILQTLIVGMPTHSAFSRIFQFGMRQGMRPYTTGSSWWGGECGPFWGHNALVRIKPFMDHCHLPTLPGKPPLGGSILSHDAVEAAFMRRGGFECRILPVELGSFEENPPTILEFTRRDLRWCQGNLQYLKLMREPGLLPMSRFQLFWAILMFAAIPAWTALILLAALKPFDGENLADFPSGLAATIYVVFMLMYMTPKLAGFLDVLLTKGKVKSYGGYVRFAVGFVMELIFAFLLGATTTLRTTMFIIGLAFGKSVTWNGQLRDAHSLPFMTAAMGLWPQFVFGFIVLSLMAFGAPSMIPWSLPLTAGYVLAVPFAMITASPALGRFLERTKLCGVPEEFVHMPEVEASQGKAG